ncbi:MAG: Uma2 family endonuclease [Thermoanaerobaculia bacterium]|nr:Uma2 family endonuclease [Thermoanaerobaculia bacterium]
MNGELEVNQQQPVLPGEPLSEYEIERGKPMPSQQHARLQTRIAVYFGVHFADEFEALTELTLDTPGEKSIPDISICSPEAADFNRDEIIRKDPPLATIEILSPSQNLQTLIDKTNDYFSFGVRSCWIVIPALQSVYVYKAPFDHEVFSLGEEIVDPNLNIRVPMDVIFSKNPGFKV